ncbi:hypothetical protein [Actinoallomurus acaciae]|uniref:Uncharacterized protein n=1 Tax=Actinoallomurus acaciae TaxID=502577 RepID=A0ABV5YRF1_9ACTN
MEDVHRAGGIPALMGELHRAGLLNEDVYADSLGEWLKTWDVRGGSPLWSSSTPLRDASVRPAPSPNRPTAYRPRREPVRGLTLPVVTVEVDGADPGQCLPAGPAGAFRRHRQAQR